MAPCNPKGLIKGKQEHQNERTTYDAGSRGWSDALGRQRKEPRVTESRQLLEAEKSKETDPSLSLQKE